MSKKVASGIVAAVTAVATTVVGMTWPGLSPSISIPILALCGVGLIVAVVLWFWPGSRSDEITSGQTARTTGDGSPAMAAGRDIHNYYGPPAPAEKQERKSPHGTRKPFYTEEGLAGLERVMRGLSGPPTPPTAWHPPRQPDLPLNGLLVRVYGEHRKKGGVVPKGGKALADFQRSINLKIADTVKLNKLHVWARLGDRALDPISEYDWSVGTFDHVKKSLFVPAAYADGAEYTDLHFSKAEIDRVWPEDDDDGQKQQ